MYFFFFFLHIDITFLKEMFIIGLTQVCVDTFLTYIREIPFGAFSPNKGDNSIERKLLQSAKQWHFIQHLPSKPMFTLIVLQSLWQIAK